MCSSDLSGAFGAGTPVPLTLNREMTMQTNQTNPNGSSMFRVRCWRFVVPRRTRSIFHLPSSILPRRFPLSVFSFLLSLVATSAATRYVDASSASPAPPYTSWATAARVIQVAVDAAAPGDEIVVTNGLYATGGRVVGTNLLVNRVAVDKPLTLRSVNGPQFTVIQGYQVPGTTNGDGAIRCVYLASGASLSGFTLSNGATRTVDDWPTYRESSGGALWCESRSVVVSNCVLVANSAYGRGGGAYDGTLKNCVVTGNSARWYGGGAYGGTLNNCTLTGNSAYDNGGGAAWGTLNNCIVYYNSARTGGANYYGGTLNYCSTTPLPEGTGNVDEEPQLASAWRLSVFSPCRGAGNAAYATGTDIDGEPWANPPSIRCDEYRAGALTGPLTVSINAAYTNVAVGFPVDLTAWIQGRPTLSVWDFDDGDFALDQPWTTHAWTAPGDYVVALWAFNETHPEGVNTTLTVQVLPQTVHYVASANSNPLPPYLSWATAATNIQDTVIEGSNHSFDLVWLDLLFPVAPAVQFHGGTLPCPQVQPIGNPAHRQRGFPPQPRRQGQLGRITLAPLPQLRLAPTQPPQFLRNDPLRSHLRTLPPQFPGMRFPQLPLHPLQHLLPERLAPQTPTPTQRLTFGLIHLLAPPRLHPTLELRSPRRRVRPDPVFAQQPVHPDPPRPMLRGGQIPTQAAPRIAQHPLSPVQHSRPHRVQMHVVAHHPSNPGRRLPPAALCSAR